MRARYAGLALGRGLGLGMIMYELEDGIKVWINHLAMAIKKPRLAGRQVAM